MPRLHQTKRKRSDKGVEEEEEEEIGAGDIATRFEEAFVKSKGGTEMAVIHLLHKYNFDLDTLKAQLASRGLNVSFSEVKYENIAPFVNLDPHADAEDAKTFLINRARIPTRDFKNIVEELQRLGSQYRRPQDHANEEARSRYIAGSFNIIVSWFGSILYNTPESIMEGRMIMRGRIEYHFKCFGGCTVLFIEMKVVTGTAKERVNAIAQVIAECDACDYANARLSFEIPIIGVLCDGSSFEFFSFDSTSDQITFLRGLPNVYNPPRMKLTLPDHDAGLEYITTLRPVCETLFSLFLTGYINAFSAYQQQSVKRAVKAKQPRDSTPRWVDALNTAREAFDMAQVAEMHAAKDRKDVDNIRQADELATKALELLETSVRNAPPAFQRRVELMTYWDDVVVGSA